jgi:hypothetical protein
MFQWDRLGSRGIGSRTDKPTDRRIFDFIYIDLCIKLFIFKPIYTYLVYLIYPLSRYAVGLLTHWTSHLLFLFYLCYLLKMFTYLFIFTFINFIYFTYSLIHIFVYFLIHLLDYFQVDLLVKLLVHLIYLPRPLFPRWLINLLFYKFILSVSLSFDW